MSPEASSPVSTSPVSFSTIFAERNPTTSSNLAPIKAIQSFLSEANLPAVTREASLAITMSTSTSSLFLCVHISSLYLYLNPVVDLQTRLLRVSA